MRGVDAVLVEKRDLAHGTTGRYHGLLHSGARYAVNDPATATECIRENKILRRIMPHCIEDTGGFFVTTPWDDPGYGDRFFAACSQAGIPADELSPGQLWVEEPHLNPDIIRCFRVPDGSADSFAGAEANIKSARQYGAQIKTYHEVTRLLKKRYQVVGAVCHDLVADEEVNIIADLIVNAAGAWAGQIGAMAGLQIPVRCGKGTMVAMHHRLLRSVVNRCRPSADGDIIVPSHTVMVIGTTDVKVDDPEILPIEPWEIQLMLDEGEKLVPGVKNMRILRVWSGVRPLYDVSQLNTESDRAVSRSHALLDHETLDATPGMVTMVGGKWTTYRLMAQETVDLVCRKLGIEAACNTHLEQLPGSSKRKFHNLGSPLAHVEEHADYGQLVCECELVTQQVVQTSITLGGAKAIDDIRRDTRLGMGTCQGVFCSYRAAGIWHRLRTPPVAETQLMLRDFLQERWKGVLPALGGQQLRQERFSEMVYRDVLNVDHLPGAKKSRLSCVMYDTQGANGEINVQ
jgi:glycerol-3-phosphate dehydrogenase